MPDLTDADLEALVGCAASVGLRHALRAAHKAGLAAGRARERKATIEECAKVCDGREWGEFGSSGWGWVICKGCKPCAAAIRALIKS